LFLWSGAIFLPATQSRKRRLTGAGHVARLWMGESRWAAVLRYGAPNCNTSSQSAGDDLSRGDPLNHPRYRDFAMIPEAEFFQ